VSWLMAIVRGFFPAESALSRHVNSMPSRVALFCPDCESVVDGRNCRAGHCAVCGGDNLSPLAVKEGK
jgi:hypothetical protein